MTNDLDFVWSQLSQIQALRFHSQSRTGIGWSGLGSGSVKVTPAPPNALVFEESGRWVQNGGREIRFTNVYRWTLLSDRIRLEHLRFGLSNPVFLFELAPNDEGTWRDIKPHLCRDDCYSATLSMTAGQLFLRWSINGPRHDETIDYIYI
jgi:hypothetical protein